MITLDDFIIYILVLSIFKFIFYCIIKYEKIKKNIIYLPNDQSINYNEYPKIKKMLQQTIPEIYVDKYLFCIEKFDNKNYINIYEYDQIDEVYVTVPKIEKCMFILSKVGF